MEVKLEKFSSKDISKVISWIPDKEFLMQWAGPSYTMEAIEKQMLNELELMEKENSKNMMFSAKTIENDELVGHIQLMGIDRINCSVRIGRVLVGDNENRGKGIGVQMLNYILDFAFNTLNMHRVDLGVFDFNKSAIICYEKAGFVAEGKFRDCRKINGEYWSLINMSILEDEYRNQKMLNKI